MEELFFKDWESLGHVAISTLVAFVTLFLFVRVSGKRTLAKLNAFDFVVTVALGSTLAYMMLGMVPLLEGVEVLFLIIAMQYVFAWTARSSSGVEKLINSVPTMLFYDGQFLDKFMSREAVTREEIFAAIRSSGIEHINDVKAVVIEINGQMTVVKKSEGIGQSSLEKMPLHQQVGD